MHYIIDGYNLFFQMYDSIPSEENRKNFVLILSDLMKKANLSGELIFDMPLHHEIIYPHSRENPPLIICYAPTNLEADDLIIEKLYAVKIPAKILVVTSDNALKQRVRDTGANISTGKAFLSFLKKKNKVDKSHKKPTLDSQSHLDRLEEIFLQRLADATE